MKKQYKNIKGRELVARFLLFTMSMQENRPIINLLNTDHPPPIELPKVI